MNLYKLIYLARYIGNFLIAIVVGYILGVLFPVHNILGILGYLKVNI